VPTDYAPNKLKSGAGEHCVRLLDALTDAALKVNAFAWKRWGFVEEEDRERNSKCSATLTVEEPEQADVITDEAEITAEQFDEEVCGWNTLTVHCFCAA
jgi:hypothetical protein